MRDVALRNPRGTLSFQASGRKECCPNKEIFMTSLKRELIKLFKEHLQLRQDYLKRCLNWTEENETSENADVALYETGMQLQSQRMEPLSGIRLEGKRAGCVKNLQ